MKLKKNVGKVDQIIRYVIAVVLVVLAFVLPLYWLLIPAAIALFTALFSFCGLYKLFGINTCKVEMDKK
ncbi:MAG: hypothetical protein A2Y45_01115 [Tenericutes bacterium GWC2_34_14]|nr:MAG: hypothetical protein A2Z84_01730 [Tenericutes bacterium GWA2_35_7]OHE29497.1 MAG: hypothetical protein A2Y45_01115 [Tenericutes bacterium GWC2_34_14]OHE34593.1 MAG: hypothetical protein A2012_08735 [Tenericutes bacterium GWE2_34_108]OHE35950.1 MAG: hypothetical protein A2Y46_03440 [Tenericutes bacterium GWF1_35_14]OHE38964.1 MAG: hypothetical protein A2Y44_06490 [Tenericutes bacterium GWF2_35_184]OHE42969.1 MAG: hypothetical protein A2221_09745 [Tenericutes bacterium RIFOXYA2_FULL_36_3